jgi:hypothetical protein
MRFQIITTPTPNSNSVVFDVRDVVFGRTAGIRIDPVRNADLGLRLLQAFAGLEVAFARAAGEAVGLGLGSRREGSA